MVITMRVDDCDFRPKDDIVAWGREIATASL
jgi:hypothetical protein